MKYILIFAIILGLGAGAVWFANEQYCIFDRAPAGQANLISGTVTKKDNDKIYFEVSAIKSCNDQVSVNKEEKTAVVSPTTYYFVRNSSLSQEITAKTLEDITVGEKIAVHYSQRIDKKNYEAEKVEMLAESDKFRVDNLIKNLNK